MQILAISGSLRLASSNSALVRACALLAPRGVDVAIYEGLGGLPHFNPDYSDVNVPPPVADFRSRLDACDALLICSPEYAHGVPGTRKNALDWGVGSGELIDKPVALVNVAPHATHAQASLAETIGMMSGRIVREACVAVPLAGRKLDAPGIAADAVLAGFVATAINALANAAGR